MPLLELPEEILLLHILSSLNLTSLMSCLVTCRKLHALIGSSMLLTYLRELELAGLVNNFTVSFEAISIQERLEMLRERERRWLTLDWKWKKRASVTVLAGGIDDVVPQPGGIMAGLRDEDYDFFRKLAFGTLPILEDESIKWTSGLVGLDNTSIVAFHSSIPEHDLVVLITVPTESSESDDDEDGMRAQTVHILSYPTLEPHPLTFCSSFDVTSLPGECTDLYTYGDNLFIWPLYGREADFNGSPNSTYLKIFNWKTGEQTARLVLPVESSSSDVILLREDVILIPNPGDISLDVYVIPDCQAGTIVELRKVCTFALPRISPHLENEGLLKLENLKCYITPAPTSRFEEDSGKVPFVADLCNSILLVEIEVGGSGEVGSWPKTYRLVTHFRILLDTVVAKCNMPSGRASISSHTCFEVASVKWSEWKKDTFSYIHSPEEGSTAFGQRIVLTDFESHTARILDFNPHRVRRFPNSNEDEEFTSRTDVLSQFPFVSDDNIPKASLPFWISKPTVVEINGDFGFRLMQDRVLIPLVGEVGPDDDEMIVGLETIYFG